MSQWLKRTWQVASLLLAATVPAAWVLLFAGEFFHAWTHESIQMLALGALGSVALLVACWFVVDVQTHALFGIPRQTWESQCGVWKSRALAQEHNNGLLIDALEAERDERLALRRRVDELSQPRAKVVTLRFGSPLPPNSAS